MSLIYEAVNLKKSYESVLALDLPSFTLERGSALALLGPNGSGKSTFLRLLSFLDKPTSGELRYFGGSFPRRECTLVLQEPWLLRENVFNNVTLGLKLRGERGDLKEKFEKAMHAAGFANPEAFSKRRPGALSGGEKQRVALASRLILHPVVLLLDEPTAYVDRASAACIIAALRREHEKGLTIICATHDPTLAKALSATEMEMPGQNGPAFCG